MKRHTYLANSLRNLIAVGLLLPTYVLAAPDTIFVSENVITMTGAPKARPLAVAIKDGRIVQVAPLAEMEQTGIGDRAATQIVELGDQALLPGFIDAHGHASFLALTTQLANIASPPVGPVQNIADLQNVLRKYIAERELKQGEWVIGQGYDDSLLAEQRHPNRDDLDAVSTKHPIYLIHVSGHLASANSKALARAGINAESPNPLGGIIRRRPNSQEPNGVLEESAQYPLRQYMNAPVKDPVASVAAAMRTYASYGITTAQDGAASSQVVELFKAADAAGQVTMDVVIYPMGQHEPERRH